MQDARIAIAMVRISKQKRELQAAQEAHQTTRQRYSEALQVAQYLKVKVESLRNVIAGLTAGAPLQIVLDGYSYEFEELEHKWVAKHGLCLGRN